jgi:hypothetical protein
MSGTWLCEHWRVYASKARPFAILSFLAAISFLAGLLFFNWANNKPPSRPAFPNGGILVFADIPHESVKINFTVNTQGYFSISVSGRGGNFLVVASGSAAVEPVHPSGGDTPDFTRGILIHSVTGRYGVGVWKDKDGAFRATNPATVTYEINGYVGNRDVLVALANQYSGTVTSVGKYFVFGRLRNPIVARSGSIELGRLPLIGTPSMVTNGSELAYQGPMSPVTISGQLSSLLRTVPFPSDTKSTKWYTPKANVRISIVSSKELVGNFIDPSSISPPFLPPKLPAGLSRPAH